MNLTCDVAVIAAGPAGLAAAIAAAEKEKKVIVFEKAAVTGGTANMGMGPFAVESHFQKDMMENLTVEKAFEDYMRETRWHVDARLVKNYFEKSGDTISWLEDMGVKFAGANKYFPGSHRTWHMVLPEDGGFPGPRSAGTMCKRMTERAAELGVEIHTETPVKKILKEDGKITGVVAVDKTGAEISCSAKAVIIATGGFGNNVEMIKENTGYTYGTDIFNFRIPGVDGDGLKMAWEAGAGKGRMSMEKITHLVAGVKNDMFLPLSNIFNQPNLIVNLEGHRVMNEELMENTSYASNVVDIQKDRRIFSILDKRIVGAYKRNGVDVPNDMTKMFGDIVAYFEEMMPKAVEAAPESMIIAGSIEELAEKMGCPYEELKKTIDEYNELCEDNWDSVFGKDRRFLRPIDTAPFYAAAISIGAYGSLGGILIDSDLRVLTEDHIPIPGLYGAGSDVNDIYDGSYVFTFPGNTMGFALNSGRMAGENAADFIENDV